MKRLTALILSFVIAVSLFGCGAAETAPAQTVPETTAPAETTVPPTETETEPPVTEPVFDLSTWQGNYDQGLYYMEGKRWQEAYDAFAAAVALDPQQPDGYAQRGNVLLRLEENEENLSLAWEDYQQALTLEDTNALAHLGIVDVHIRRAEYDKADAAMENAVKKTDNDPLLEKMVSCLDRGIYMDSSYKYRFTRERYYDNGGRYIGYITVKYEDGIPALAESFNASGKSVSVLELSEIKEGNVTERNYYGINLTGTAPVLNRHYQKTTLHDDGSREYESVSYGRDGSRGSSGHSYYNADDQLIRHESYDSNGNLQFYSTAEYDAEGRQLLSCNHNADGTIREYTEFHYDSEGKQIRSDYYYGGELNSYRVSVYDEAGHRIAVEHYDKNGVLTLSVVDE